MEVGGAGRGRMPYQTRAQGTRLNMVGAYRVEGGPLGAGSHGVNCEGWTGLRMAA